MRLFSVVSEFDFVRFVNGLLILVISRCIEGIFDTAAGAVVGIECSIHVSEFFFFLRAYDGRDDGDEETGNREAETNALPKSVVTAVRVLNVGLEGFEKKETESVRHEVLDGEVPPELEDALPAVDLSIADILAELAHGTGELAHTGEAAFREPLTEG